MNVYFGRFSIENWLLVLQIERKNGVLLERWNVLWSERGVHGLPGIQQHSGECSSSSCFCFPAARVSGLNGQIFNFGELKCLQCNLGS